MQIKEYVKHIAPDLQGFHAGLSEEQVWRQVEWGPQVLDLSWLEEGAWMRMGLLNRS